MFNIIGAHRLNYVRGSRRGTSNTTVVPQGTIYHTAVACHRAFICDFEDSLHGQSVSPHLSERSQEVGILRHVALEASAASAPVRQAQRPRVMQAPHRFQLAVSPQGRCRRKKRTG